MQRMSARESAGLSTLLALGLAGLALSGCSERRGPSSVAGPRSLSPGFDGVAGSGAVTLISNDPSLTNPGPITTDGAKLYVGNGNAILSVPIGGGAATTLYASATPCCVVGLTRIGASLFWIDPNGDPDATAIFRGTSSGGAITKIYSGFAAGQPIVDGVGVATDGTKLYTTDDVQGRVNSLNPDGSAMTLLGSRYGGFFYGEHFNTLAENGGTLFIVDPGNQQVGPYQPQLLEIPATGGSFTTIVQGAPLVTPIAVAAGDGKIFIADPGAGNTIWSVPIAGGTPTALVSGAPFVQLGANGLVFFNHALYVTDNGNSGAEDGPGAIYRVSLATDQTISFGALSNRTFGDPPFTITASASSGLAVSFTASGACTVAGSTVSLTGAGACTITALQAGDASFNAAPNVTQSFTIAKATPVIAWSPPASMVYGTALSGTQLDATATGVGGVALTGAFSYSPSAGTVLNPGPQTLTVSFTPDDVVNYTGAGTRATIAVLYNTAVGHVFLSPIKLPPQPQRVFKVGSTIPVKFQLFLADGVTPVSTAVATLQVSTVPGGVPVAVASTVPSQGVTFRYDPLDQQYVFNLATDRWSMGSYRLIASLDDGSRITVVVGAR